MGLFFDLPSRPGQGSQLFPPPISPDLAILAAGRQECAVKALAIFATLAILAVRYGGRRRRRQVVEWVAAKAGQFGGRGSQ